MLNAQAIREAFTTVLSDVSKDDGKSAGWVSPYDGEKGPILLETRMFNETPLNATKCFDCLTKVLNLIVTKGKTLTPQEESVLFFGVTKLFQSNNDRLRRMVYLVIKSLTISEGESFIVTSSLTKDMNSVSDVHRANAIRALSKIVDSSLASQIERYLKITLVDKSPFVASAALVCGLSLLRTAPELVRRWVSEVSEAVRSKHTTVQFHALALLYELKQSDRLALHKVVGTLTASALKSPLAECLLIRYATRILRSERDRVLEKSVADYLVCRLHHRSDSVMLEAARALCDLAADDPKGGMEVCGTDFTPALTALQIMLSSTRPAVRFAAVRTLNKLSLARPLAVSRCNPELESLLVDGNRSIATLALTTLLKTGHESGVERLIKQMSSLMAEIADSFKVEVIKAVRLLATTYLSKHRTMMNFLATQLREEGSYEVKKDLIEALAMLMMETPSAREPCLLHLCEFIEDCEYAVLCTRVLALLGEWVHLTSYPSKFVRFIYNRLILENASVRAAAIDALSRVALNCPPLRKDISTLIESCLVDGDDEIRDRSRLYYRALQVSRDPTHEESDGGSTTASSQVSLDDLLSSELPMSVDACLEYAQHWIENKGAEGPLDLTGLMSEEEYQQRLSAQASTITTAQAASTSQTRAGATTSIPAAAKPVMDTEAGPAGASELLRVCSGMYSIEALGELDHSCKPYRLTENEAEYAVSCVKHIFNLNHVVLEFQVTNTMPDQKLQNVEVCSANYDPVQWSVMGASKIPELIFDIPSSCFIILKMVQEQSDEAGSFTASTGTFAVSLNYVVKEEGDDFGFDDSYALEPVVVTIADYVYPRALRSGQFKPQWNLLADSGEATSKLSLTYRTLESAIVGIVESLNLAPCEGTETVQPTATSHDLLLAGLRVNGVRILAKCMIVMSPKHGCLLKIICRSKDKQFSEQLLTVFE